MSITKNLSGLHFLNQLPKKKSWQKFCDTQMTYEQIKAFGRRENWGNWAEEKVWSPNFFFFIFSNFILNIKGLVKVHQKSNVRWFCMQNLINKVYIYIKFHINFGSISSPLITSFGSVQMMLLLSCCWRLSNVMKIYLAWICSSSSKLNKVF